VRIRFVTATARAACLSLFLVEAPMAQQPAQQRSTAAQREDVAITVYNQNFGLVREVRNVDVGRGTVALEFRDVAANIQPETVHIVSLTAPDALRVLEQNYQFDLLSPQKLLEKYVGRQVTIYRHNEQSGRDEPVQAEVLSVNQGTILRIGDEITYNYPGRIAFPSIPENLIAQPTLVWLVDSRQPRQRVEVSYLTQNLNWKADYVFAVNADDTAGDLTGWVTLSNQSGASYENARLKLVAGDVQRVAEREARMRPDMLEARAAQAPQFAEEAFFEYHLYTLERAATVLNNEQKQITLLEAGDVPVTKRMIFYGQPYFYRGAYGQPMSNQKVGVYLDFVNSERNHLGMPLPRGIVRVYKADRTGAQQFVGEDRIDHTPRDERLRVKVGEAFDVVGERRQTEYRVISSCVSESGWEISLRNHKDEAQEVQDIEPVGGDWEILTSSHSATKLDARTFSYTVTVPARSEVKITYRVRVRWC